MDLAQVKPVALAQPKPIRKTGAEAAPRGRLPRRAPTVATGSLAVCPTGGLTGRARALLGMAGQKTRYPIPEPEPEKSEPEKPEP